MRSVVLLVSLVAAGHIAWNAVSFQGAPAASSTSGDQWLTRPVDDRTFNTYLDFFAYDHKLPLDTKTTKTEDVGGVTREYLSFQSTAGVRVTAILFRATGRNIAKAPALILLHGGNPQGKDGAGPIRMAERLCRAGWSVLALDLLYFGERSTTLMR